MIGGYPKKKRKQEFNDMVNNSVYIILHGKLDKKISAKVDTSDIRGDENL